MVSFVNLCILLNVFKNIFLWRNLWIVFPKFAKSSISQNKVRNPWLRPISVSPVRSGLKSRGTSNWFPEVWTLRNGFWFVYFLFVCLAYDHKSICILSMLHGKNRGCKCWGSMWTWKKKVCIVHIGSSCLKRMKIILLCSSLKNKLYHYPRNPLLPLNMERKGTSHSSLYQTASCYIV